MTSSSDWAWKFTPRAASQFDELDPHVHDPLSQNSTRLSPLNGELPMSSSNHSPAVRSRNFESGNTDLPVSSTTTNWSWKFIGSNTEVVPTLQTTIKIVSNDLSH